MRIIVDHDVCTGHGRCAAVAPKLFTLDANGFCAITELVVPDGLVDDARAGANNCPERAIALLDD